MKLNAGQELCARKFHRWWHMRDKPTFEISGAAGTGKTTLVKYILENEGIDIKEVLFVAYVGKATLPLEKNGLNAKTIHSAICDMEIVYDRDENGKIITGENDKPILRPVFKRKPSLPSWVKAVVVDEGSMVPDWMCDWLISYGIPLIILGDLNQLEPVFGTSLFLKNPDAILTEIMRQAKGSPIIELADKVLHGKMILPGKYGDNDEVNIITEQNEFTIDYKSADIMICAKNKTRKILNEFYRNVIYGRFGKYPIVGDRLICRKNNWTISNSDGVHLVNGMIGYVKDVHLEKMTSGIMRIDFQPEDFDGCFYDIDMDKKLFNKMDALEEDVMISKSFSNYDIFEYGYCITCHLSQGSQYGNIIIKYEPVGSVKHRQRWLYTAITRAINKLTLII